MKQMKAFTTMMLSVLLSGCLTTPALAASVPSEKEEVIYIMTDASGKSYDVEAVNIFSGGDILDYGNYSSVKTLNTTDSIQQDGDKITFSSDADKVYYQGTMNNPAIPWNISIRYFLDEKEYTAEEIAGKSGKLEIHFVIFQNNKCTGDFYENYALQATFTLDGDSCRNIQASDATIANVGTDKQLSYTILPGKGIDTIIKADVTDFTMDSIAINGVRLNLNIEVDQGEINGKIDELISAIESIDTASSKLNSGSSSLSDATDTLNSKVADLNAGAGSLAAGSNELDTGLATIAAQNDTLTQGAYSAYQGLCTAASGTLNSQLEANGLAPVKLTPSNYSDVLMGLLKQMNADTVYQEAYNTALLKVTNQVNAQADDLYRGYIQSEEDTICQKYILDQADALYTQVASQAIYEQLLQSGYREAEATAYLQTASGQEAIAQAVSAMTDEQKKQITDSAAASLSTEQREQICQGALQALTDDQKAQIRESYIQQMMASDEVTSQINTAVSKVSTSAEQIASLKGQLDNYGVFYRRLVDYTSAVGSAAAGAHTLNQNMELLHNNTGILQSSVGELNTAVHELNDGTKKLADGTSEFSTQTADMDTQIQDEITSMTDSITGGDAQTVSFVSDKNTNVNSVQFVIKTSAIEIPEDTDNHSEEETPLTFWQKLLRLFTRNK